MSEKATGTSTETSTETTSTPRGSGAQYFVALGIGVLLLGVVLYLFPPATQEINFVKENTAALPFELPYVDKEGTLSWEKDLKGRVVLLNFWATWCAPCLEEMPAMHRLHEKLEAEGLTVVAISEDDHVYLPKNYALEQKFSFPVLFDDDHRVASRWGTFKYPETYIIGRDGLVKRKLFGPAEWDNDAAVEYFRELLKTGTQVSADAPEIPTDPSAARSPEREGARTKAEKAGGAPEAVRVGN